MDYIAGVVQKYKTKGIIVDTNLLILYIVGFYNIDYIERFARVKNKKYSKEDFGALARLISLFKVIFVTPQILAELSNLSFKNEKNRDFEDDNFNGYLVEVIRIITGAKENFSPKEKLMDIAQFCKFGFTDISILDLAQQERLPVITDDLRLHHLLINLGVDSLNMNTIRTQIIL
jgi:rRNA-processing protein FCF1